MVTIETMSKPCQQSRKRLLSVELYVQHYHRDEQHQFKSSIYINTLEASVDQKGKDRGQELIWLADLS
jgi:predicted metallo-beta-lactamase superfamily hydrolase